MTGDIEAILETSGAAALEIAASALAERGEKPGSCANCAKPLIGAYCAVCGQPTKTRRRSVRGLLHDFVVDLVNFDSRILRTARALLLQPGELPQAFRQGRTQPYVPSIRLYLFVSLIFFVLLNVMGVAILQLQVKAKQEKIIRDAQGNYFVANPAYDPGDEDGRVVPKLLPIKPEKAQRKGGLFQYSTQVFFFSRIGTVHSNLSADERAHLAEPTAVKVKDKKGQEVADEMSSRITGTMAKVAADPAALNGPLTDWIPRALFALLPIYALLLALFHVRRRKEYFLVDHLVFSLSIHTVLFVVLIAAIGLVQVLSGDLVALIVFLALSIYIFIAMKRFYRQGWIMTTIKFLFISGIYCIFCLIPAFIAVLFFSAYYGGGSIGIG